MKFMKLVTRAISVVFEYETLKIVSINSKKVGSLCRFIQLAIVAYIIGYVLVYKKGYQEFETGFSGLISKVKGVSYSNRSIAGRGNVWDVADYVIPPEEKDAFFVTTNALITRKQTQGQCPEDFGVYGAACSSNKDCKRYDPILLGDGVKTGICNTSTSTCEVFAWCPVESSVNDNATVQSPLLNNVVDFTILIKNTVEFVRFKVTRSNIPTFYNKTKLRTCRFHPQLDKLCPIFTIGTILNMTGTSYNDIAKIGGIISFVINWNCDFDKNVENCLPNYSFRRLDKADANISKGWNFRYANYYYIGDVQYRDLVKAYGIRFIVTVTSKAGKFNIMPLTMNIGSGLALLGIATVVCDFIVIYCLNKRDRYIEAKYHQVAGDDAYKPFNSESEEQVN